MSSFWRQSVLIRAAMLVVSIGLIVGLGFVLLTAALTERRDQQFVIQRVNELMRTVERTAQVACFTRDEHLALEVVNGLATNSEIYGTTLLGGSDVLAEHWKGHGPRAEGGRISMAIASPFDAAQIVGELIVVPDPKIVGERSRESSAFVALMLFLQLLAVVLAVAIAVLLLIVRPIKRMSDQLHGMDSIGPLDVPTGHENTEIGRFVSDINQLSTRLKTLLEEEHRLHVQREIGERKYRAIFENADSGIFMIDQYQTLESCNQAFFRQLDLPPSALDENPSLFSLSWRDPAALTRLVEQCAAQSRPVSDDFEYMAGGNEVRWFGVVLTPVGDGFIQGQLTDISRHKQMELAAQQEAVTDALTGLLNRVGFLRKVDEEITACANDENAGFALLIVNFDGFRRVNESLGLASGDRILSITAHRLRSCVKGSDLISRLGGDSFAIVLRSVSDEKSVANVAMRISVVLKNFFEVGKTPLQLSVSIGITMFPHDGGDQEVLLRNAEMALEHARLSKGKGNRYCFFDFTMARNAEYRRRLEDDLRFAVRRGELIIHFQPIIDLFARRMAGVEALTRWEHPLFGRVPPDIFIPLAEETGTIVNIGLWIVEAVCQQLAQWKKQGIDRYISLNVSARQIPDGLPPITLIEMVNRYGVDPGSVAIEITESVFMGDSEAVKTWLDAVHELGFRIYLDDFGTGYSSLSYIKRFPVDVLKVDKSFVRDMSEDNNDRALVVAIINMARSLELTVVAEGVETQRQLDLLEVEGCRCVQGYYFSHPVAASEIEAVRQHVEQML